MIATESDFVQALEQLRHDGSDSWELEVKRASGGTPQLADTLCAFANMPEGGSIVLGLDESSGFTAVGVHDAAALEQGIAAQARQQLEPQVQVHFWRATLEGKTLVIANVHGLPSFQRPCRVRSTQKAYLRFADGDYVLSEQEIQQILSARERPRHDTVVIEGTTQKDLDPQLKDQFIRSARLASKRLDREDDEQILRLKRVIEPEGDGLTVAGLYALGRYPQQFLPSMSLTAVLRSASDPEVRNADRQTFDGPLPEILDNAVQWVMRNIRTRVRFGTDGHGYDSTEVPVVAVREIIANALVHRDLSQHTWGKDVQLILDNDKLVVTSPGGLWGLTTDQLGKGNAKSAVNEFLYDICQLTTTSEGHRVIEGEGGGLREVHRALRRVGMKEPQFFDSGVKFTVILPRHTLFSEEDLQWLETLPHNERLKDMQRHVLVSMQRGQTWTNEKMRKEFGPLDSHDARTMLQELVSLGLAETSGGGRWTTYRLRDTWADLTDESDQLEIDFEAPDPAETQGSALRSATNTDTNSDLEALEHRAALTSRHGKALWAALMGGSTNVQELSEATNLSLSQVRYGMQRLVNAGIIKRTGGQGYRQTTYSLP